MLHMQLLAAQTNVPPTSGVLIPPSAALIAAPGILTTPAVVAGSAVITTLVITTSVVITAPPVVSAPVVPALNQQRCVETTKVC